MIVADAGGPLRFLPLPELSTLHTNNKTFSATRPGVTMLVPTTTNSFHLTAEFDVASLSNHSRAPVDKAEITLKFFQPASASLSVPPAASSEGKGVAAGADRGSSTGGDGGSTMSSGVKGGAAAPSAPPEGLGVSLLPPWSAEGQAMLNHTSVVGDVLKVDRAATTARACAAACVARADCGAWTLREPSATAAATPTESTAAPASVCTLMHVGAQVMANVGSGCDALGAPYSARSGQDGDGGGAAAAAATHSNPSTDVCTSGIVAWQLTAPGLSSGPILVTLPAADSGGGGGGGGGGGDSSMLASSPLLGARAASLEVPVRVTIELFVDQQICELFLHDGKGKGSAVTTFGCSPVTDADNAVSLYTAGVDGASVKGVCSDMAGSIMPPPQPSE